MGSLFGLQSMQAQTDFPLSVVTSPLLQVNPASAGLFNDEFRLQTYFKSQADRSLSGSGIKGTGVSADYNFIDLNMGLGLMLYSNSVDKSALRDVNVSVSYGYRMQLGKRSLLSFGLQTGLKQVSFSMAELTFGSQYDPTYQGGYNPDMQPDIGVYRNVNSFDLSVGGWWLNYLNEKTVLNMKLAAFHLTPMRIGFLTENASLKPKFVANATARYTNNDINWIPSVLLVSQNKHNYAEVGVTSQYQVETSTQSVSLGVYYRTPNVLIPTVGISYGDFSANISFEYYMGNSYPNIFNISLFYLPQSTRSTGLIEDFQEF
ncbi:MAG: type IX secretion system membrane protein PorP/SprF [Bacteroidales bacterium]|jgi:type IX secretion system PorP/SprF family membrane protein|nr:type IX secretion system membrane protein PorP/SprF [Bacteroidales bacterium]